MAPTPQPHSVLVIDNGAYEIKAGLASNLVSNKGPQIFPNCVARSRDRHVYVGDQLRHCQDFSAMVFRRPFERGNLSHWESEKAIWDRVIYGGDEVASGYPIIRPNETALIVTEPVAQLPVCSSNIDQIVFEEYGFATYLRTFAASLAHENDIPDLFLTARDTSLSESKAPPRRLAHPDTTLIVDLGYSASTITPIIENVAFYPSIRKLTVGGKLLRNYLKETISFRYYNMMDETYIVDKIKEQCCFISNSYDKDLETCKKVAFAKNPLSIEYVLPRATATGFKQGHIREVSENRDPDDQILTLANERFSVPEILFHPSDIGLQQAGLAEAIMQSVAAVPDPDVQDLLLSNVVFIGGSTLFPGFRKRIHDELQTLVPSRVNLRMGFPDDPISYTWQGGAKLGLKPSRLKALQVTRREYQEHGSNICFRKFGKKH
ncbi:actin family [Lipomyces oligophaga]|uniref:actin family n=1 Tax=Lipomyces oligophaga TaxID=45792 RepID=UPI0034D01985